MAEQKKKYVVAPGASFVGNRKTYKEGDEIDETAFKDKARFEAFTKGAKPKIIPAPTGEEKADPLKNDPPDRKALEKMAIDGGLAKEKDVSSIKDDDLKKLLTDAGLLK
jgi:hypothetical protein